MITARPQTRTLISFILFLGIAYSIAGVNVYIVLVDPMVQWFNYLILALLIPIAGFVTVKVFSRYKIVRMGHRQIEVLFPQFRIQRKYGLEEVKGWEETVVKTGKTATYKELEVNFQDGRTIRMGFREYTEYTNMLNYLAKKIPKARKPLNQLP